MVKPNSSLSFRIVNSTDQPHQVRLFHVDEVNRALYPPGLLVQFDTHYSYLYAYMWLREFKPTVGLIRVWRENGKRADNLDLNFRYCCWDKDLALTTVPIDIRVDEEQFQKNIADIAGRWPMTGSQWFSLTLPPNEALYLDLFVENARDRISEPEMRAMTKSDF